MRQLLLCLALLALPLALFAAWLLFGPRLPSPFAHNDSATPTADLASEVEGMVHHDRVVVGQVRIRFQDQCTFTDAQGRFRVQIPFDQQGRRLSASKDGYALSTVPVGRRPLLLALTPLPTMDNEDYAWIDPTPNASQPNNCGNCHAQIYRDWAGSGHARATSGRFRELFGASLYPLRPEGAGVCVACHAPTFRDSTLDYDLRQPPGLAAQGVHCDYCHKIADAPTDKRGTRFGRDGLPLLRPPNGQQLFFGPLDDAQRDGEQFAYAPFYKESRYCASCHEGVVFGQHAYGTYSEWLQSPARQRGQQCQTCHMAPTGTLHNIAPGKGGIDRDPWSLSSHRLPGGQVEMLRRCLKVEAKRQTLADGVRVQVEIRTDNVGHRVPTGFIDRHLLLVVEAFDAVGALRPRQHGSVLPPKAGRALVGKPGWLYAKVLADANGQEPAPFWAAHEELSDTRLTPGQVDRREFTFAVGVARVRVRLLYRRFWQATADTLGWTDPDVVVVDQVVK